MKKIPIRKCVGCNERFEKKSLIRIVKDSDNDIFIDLKGKANGRGAYICKSVECLELAVSKRALQKAFSCKIDVEVVDALKKALESEC